MLAQKWVEDLCKNLRTQLGLPVTLNPTHWINFPHIYVEWIPHEESCGRVCGEIIMHLASSMEEERGDQETLDKMRRMFCKKIDTEEGEGLLKENKIARKTDKKVRYVSLYYDCFLTRKK